MFPALLPPQTSQHFATNPSLTQSRPKSSAFYLVTPHTPSPLRTARNANLMPPKSNDLFDSSPLSNNCLPITAADENATEVLSKQTPSTKLAEDSQTSPSLFYITPPNTSFNFGKLEPAGTQQPQQGSAFEARARSASPAAVLSRHARETREGKKNRFLDRIRQRRDDERRGESVYGDQVLRMDFVRERREWEEEMARRASDNTDLDIDDFSHDSLEMELEEVNFDVQQQQQQQQHQEGMSPPDDREIDELVAHYEREPGSAHDIEQQPQSGFEGIFEDDEDYDQLFMEVIKSRPSEQDGSSLPQGSQMDMS